MFMTSSAPTTEVSWGSASAMLLTPLSRNNSSTAASSHVDVGCAPTVGLGHLQIPAFGKMPRRPLPPPTLLSAAPYASNVVSSGDAIASPRRNCASELICHDRPIGAPCLPAALGSTLAPPALRYAAIAAPPAVPAFPSTGDVGRLLHTQSSLETVAMTAVQLAAAPPPQSGGLMLGPIMASLQKSTQQQQQQRQTGLALVHSSSGLSGSSASETPPALSPRGSVGLGDTASGTMGGMMGNGGTASGTASGPQDGLLAAPFADGACLWSSAIPPSSASAGAGAAKPGASLPQNPDRPITGLRSLVSVAGSSSYADEMDIELPQLIAEAFAEISMAKQQQEQQLLLAPHYHQHYQQQQQYTQQTPLKELQRHVRLNDGDNDDASPVGRKRFHSQTSDAVSWLSSGSTGLAATAAAATAATADGWWSGVPQSEPSFGSTDSIARFFPVCWWEEQDVEFEQFLLEDVIM